MCSLLFAEPATTSSTGTARLMDQNASRRSIHRSADEVSSYTLPLQYALIFSRLCVHVCVCVSVHDYARMQLKRARLQVEWQMRDVEWLLSGLRKDYSWSGSSTAAGATFTSTLRSPEATASVPFGGFASSLSSPSTVSLFAAAGPSDWSGAFGGGSALMDPVHSALNRVMPLELLQSTLKQLVERFATVSALYSAAVREEKIAATRRNLGVSQISNVHIQCLIEQTALELMRNEKCFFQVAVEGIACALSVQEDQSGELAVEIRYFSAVNRDAEGQLSSSGVSWAEVVAPLVYGNKVWNHQNLMLSARGVKQLVGSRTVVPHLEVSLYPLNVKVTYDLLAKLADFFLTDRKAAHKHQRHKRGFLPTAPAILELDDSAVGGGAAAAGPGGPSGSGHKLSGRLSVSSTGAAADPNDSAGSDGAGSQRLAKLIKDKRLFNVAMKLYQQHQQEQLKPGAAADGSSVVDGVSNADQPPQQPGVAGSRSGPDTTEDDEAAGVQGSDGGASSTLIAQNGVDDHAMLWTYVRFNSTRVVVSYRGNRQYNVEDFQGLKIKFKTFVYQRRLWTLDKFGQRLRRDLIRNLLSQVGETLGSFLSYKFGWRGAMLRRARNQALDRNEDASARTGAMGGRYTPQLMDLPTLDEAAEDQSDVASVSHAGAGSVGGSMVHARGVTDGGGSADDEKHRELLFGRGHSHQSVHHRDESGDNKGVTSSKGWLRSLLSGHKRTSTTGAGSGTIALPAAAVQQPGPSRGVSTGNTSSRSSADAAAAAALAKLPDQARATSSPARMKAAPVMQASPASSGTSLSEVKSRPLPVPAEPGAASAPPSRTQPDAPHEADGVLSPSLYSRQQSRDSLLTARPLPPPPTQTATLVAADGSLAVKSNQTTSTEVTHPGAPSLTARSATSRPLPRPPSRVTGQPDGAQ